MGHPSELSIPLYTTHEGMCKFSTPADPNYETVRDQLVYLAKHATRETTAQSKS